MFLLRTFSTVQFKVSVVSPLGLNLPQASLFGMRSDILGTPVKKIIRTISC